MFSIRTLTYGGLMVGTLVGSFFLTLWLTKPEKAVLDDRPILEQLADGKVSDYAELRNIASALGLQISRRMGGNVDGISRASERQVTVVGWVADPDGDTTPLNLIVFVAGTKVAIAQTKGERPDVTASLRLGFGTEKNVGIQVSFDCRAGEQPVIVGLGVGKSYLPLAAPRCP
jgi:hypothetical protein